MRFAFALCSVLPVAACAGGLPAAAGSAVVVTMLDDEFVRVDGERMPVEELLYRLRLRCREVERDPERVPGVVLQLPRDRQVGAGVLERIRHELQVAGIGYLEIGVSEG